jgi:hypothetical protein
MKWLKSPWAISLGTAIFSLSGTIIYDLSKNKPILSTILVILNSIWQFIIRVLNYNIKVWWLLLFIGIITLAIYIVFRLSQDEPSPKEGKFKNWRWTWNWRWHYSKNAWVISDLKAHCPRCDTPMEHFSSLYGQSFECPRCDYRASGSECEKPHKIEAIILDNIIREKSNNAI